MINIIDSHSHLSFLAYDEDREEVINRMEKQGVASIDIGTTLETSASAVALAQKYDNIWAAVGIHPSHANKERFHDKNELAEAPKGPEIFNKEEFQKLLNNPKVVAVGECGLDYFVHPATQAGGAGKPHNVENQKKLFVEQIEFAIENEKPLVLHCRSAHGDALEILDKYKEKLLDKAGTVHFFTGSIEEAKKYIELGFYIGLDGPITFVNDYDNLVKDLSMEKILIETDCPYATPAPYRGKRNEPIYVIEIAKKIAQIKGIDLEEVVIQTTNNTKNLFGLNF